MSDDTPIHDLNTSHDKKLYGRFRNLFTKLKSKDKEAYEAPKNIDITILTPPTSTMTGILNVKFYTSNEFQAFWAILEPPKISFFDCYDKIEASTPDSMINILEFDFQQGPPSESKFKLLHIQNTNNNLQIETSMHEYQNWTKKIRNLIDSRQNEYEIEDEDAITPVYDVPKSEPRATSVVLSEDNEIAAIYDVPSKKPRPVENPEKEPELRQMPSPSNEDAYDVPSNRPVIPPRPNFSYRTVYSDGESPPGSPVYDHPKAPVAVNGESPVMYDRPKNPVPVNGIDPSELYDHPKEPVPVMKSLPASLHDKPKVQASMNAKSPATVSYDHIPALVTKEIKDLPPALPAPRRDMSAQKVKSSQEITNEVSEKVIVEGFLKLSTDINQWTKFYFTLRDRFLQAFDDTTSTQSPILIIDLSGSEFFYLPPDDSKRKYCFSLCTSSLSFSFTSKSSKFSYRNVFIFAADSFTDFNSWRTAIFDIQGVYNLSLRSNSHDQLAQFSVHDPPKRVKPIRRVFSSVLKRESRWYAEVEQKYVPEDQVYVVKPKKSKSISIPIQSRNSEKIYSRISESSLGKKPDNSILSSYLSIFSGLDWKKHWFELRDKFLTCFEFQDSIRTIFEVDVSQCFITEASKESNHEFAFKLATTQGDIVYFFFAENVNVYTEWITALMMTSIQKPMRIGNVSQSSQTSQTSLQNGSLQSEEILKSPPKLKGNLLKRTSSGKWEQRYCIVKEGVMLTYKSNQATPLQRLVLIDALVNVCNSLEVSQNHAFEIRVVNSENSHFFAAFSQTKLEEWLNGLRNATVPKSPSTFEDSNSSPDKTELQTSLNSLSTPDLKNTRPPKPVRSESVRECRSKEDKLPASHLQNPIKSGVLDYRQISSKVWGRRFCIIHDLCLYIYLHPSSEHPQKVFALPGCEIKSSLQETSKYFSFSIEQRGMKAYFSTQTIQDLKSWIEMLTKITMIQGGRGGVETLPGSPEVVFKIHTSTPNQNSKSNDKFDQIQKIITKSNQDIFDTYSHSNLAASNLRNSIESLQKKRKNLKIQFTKQKASKVRDPEKVGKMRELLLKYDEAIEEFRSTAETNKIETTSTIAYLELSREKTLKEIKSLFQSNTDLSLSQEIRGISHASDSSTLI